MLVSSLQLASFHVDCPICGLCDDIALFIVLDTESKLNQQAIMTLHARHVGFVEVPHRQGWILDDDQVILDAYQSCQRRMTVERTLWEARSGRHMSCWAIWDGDQFTGEMAANRTAAVVRILQMMVARPMTVAGGEQHCGNDR